MNDIEKKVESSLNIVFISEEQKVWYNEVKKQMEKIEPVITESHFIIGGKHDISE